MIAPELSKVNAACDSRIVDFSIGTKNYQYAMAIAFLLVKMTTNIYHIIFGQITRVSTINVKIVRMFYY